MPLDSTFWAEEQKLLQQAFADLSASALMAGMKGGIDLLPVGHQQLVNWDVVNQAAIDFLRRYNLETVTGISGTTQKQVTQLIEDWMRSGEPLDILKGKMAELPIFSPVRAASIATTEVTRIYAEGNLQSWKSTGLVGAKRWQTARDEWVCPQCGPLQGQIVGMEELFVIPEDQMSPELARQILLGKVDAASVNPPKHVNCRCWLQPIVSEEGFERELEQILG